MESVPITLAFLIDWSWLRIGPHIQINIGPVLLHIGPLALHWYGLRYVVAIVVGLWCICRDIARAFEEKLTFPGEIKVTVVRESRFMEVAK